MPLIWVPYPNHTVTLLFGTSSNLELCLLSRRTRLCVALLRIRREILGVHVQ
jgi:hypothetical protein